jgi:hypothetical protein
LKTEILASLTNTILYIILQYLRILQYSSKTMKKLHSQTPPKLVEHKWQLFTICFAKKTWDHCCCFRLLCSYYFDSLCNFHSPSFQSKSLKPIPPGITPILTSWRAYSARNISQKRKIRSRCINKTQKKKKLCNEEP